MPIDKIITIAIIIAVPKKSINPNERFNKNIESTADDTGSIVENKLVLVGPISFVLITYILKGITVPNIITTIITAIVYISKVPLMSNIGFIKLNTTPPINIPQPVTQILLKLFNKISNIVQ